MAYCARRHNGLSSAKKNGYVDHWVKWAENGDNWFCVRGFEAGGWVKYEVNLTNMSLRYRSTIIVRPQQTEPADGLHGKMYNAWLEYAHLNGIVGGIQGQISMQLFYAGFAAGVKAGRP